MTKQEIKAVMDDLRQGRRYCSPEKIFDFLEPMVGIAFAPEPKFVPHEVVVEFARYQALQLNGEFDTDALSETFALLKKKVRVV